MAKVDLTHTGPVEILDVVLEPNDVGEPYPKKPIVNLTYKQRLDKYNERNWRPEYTVILLETHRGAPLLEIAQKVRMAPQSVTAVRNSTYFLNKLAALQTKVIEKVTEKRAVQLTTDKARDVITKAAFTAARKMVIISKRGTPDQRVQYDACKDILDRAGLRPIEVIETRERVYSPEEMAHARTILKESEEIMARLNNHASPFVLRDASTVDTASSDTDESSDAIIEEAPPVETT